MRESQPGFPMPLVPSLSIYIQESQSFEMASRSDPRMRILERQSYYWLIGLFLSLFYFSDHRLICMRVCAQVHNINNCFLDSYNICFWIQGKVALLNLKFGWCFFWGGEAVVACSKKVNMTRWKEKTASD